jgi:SAM-dependent methyltransferase
MPFKIDDLYKAQLKYDEFKRNNHYSFHDRFIFPLLCGTYFAYRRVDVMRLAAIAKSISQQPRYLDVGCGYGDFLEKIREFIPTATGIEKDGNIFYLFQKLKPDYISICDIADLEGQFDVIFVGWMDPGTDFRKHISEKTEVVITTLDEGISLAAEYEDLGFHKIAQWRTPSWEDVNIELMNKYYSKLTDDVYTRLFNLRGAHCLWYVYSRDVQKCRKIKETLSTCFPQERILNQSYDFEVVLDECGYGYLELLPLRRYANKSDGLWQIRQI